MTAPKVILLACGSFSPPTPMHFRMFEIARDYIHGLGHGNVIGGIISPVHDAYGKQGLVSSTHRCEMLRIALKSSDWIRVSDWECQQESWSRTRLLLQYHQNHVNSVLNDLNGTMNDADVSWMPPCLLDRSEGRAEPVKVKLLCGADLLESFATPGLWENEDLEAILGQHGIVVISRNGADPEKFIFNSDQLTKYRRNITIITNWVPNEVSSSMIRRLLTRGESVKYLLDDGVIEYCKRNFLYGASRGAKYSLYPPNSNANSVFLTPSPSDVTMTSPSEFEIKLQPISDLYETMDETDNGSKQFKLKFGKTTLKSETISMRIEDYDDKSPTRSLKQNVFCCAENVKVNNLINKSRPGQAVKVVTDAAGNHTVIKEEVSSQNIIAPDKICTCGFNIESIDSIDIVDQFDRLQVDSKPSSRKSSKSYEDVIKFIFTEHGIRVISDKETVV